MAKFSAKVLDITKRGVLLNRLDARSIGVLDGDRVQVIDPVNGISVTAFVDTTITMAQQGTVGIYHITNDRLGVKDGDGIEIREAGRPASLACIMKMMEGDRLNKEEMLAII